MGNQSNNKSTLLSSAGFLLACLLVYGINRIGAPTPPHLNPPRKRLLPSLEQIYLHLLGSVYTRNMI